MEARTLINPGSKKLRKECFLKREVPPPVAVSMPGLVTFFHMDVVGIFGLGWEV